MNIRDMIRKMTVVSVSVGLCSTLAAVDFPGAGGDLADKDAWGGALPSATDGVTIVNAGTYTASSDIDFSAITVKTDGVVFDLRVVDGREVRLGCASDQCLRFLTPKNAQTDFQGGLWDCGGGSPYVAYSGDKTAGRKVVLDYGCVWTNVQRLTVSRGTTGPNTEFSLQGGSRLYTKELFVGYTSGNNVLRISGGSSVVLDGATGSSFYIDNKTPAVGNLVSVSGSGSELRVLKGVAHLDRENSGGRLEVTDGATASFVSLSIGHAGDCTGTELFVGNGATVTADAFSDKAYGGFITISNGTLNLPTDYRLGAGSTTNLTMRVIGDGATVPFGLVANDDLFVAGACGDAFVMDEGAQWSLTDQFRFAYSARECTMRITGGARILQHNGAFCFGERAPLSSVSNVLEITDGGVVDVNELRLSGVGNWIVVDDGSLFCTNNVESMRLGYRHPKTAAGVDPAGARLVLKGRHPYVRTDKSVIMTYGARIGYEIPKDGYDKGYCPLTVNLFSISGEGCGFDIDCEEWAKETGGRLKLAVATNAKGMDSVAGILDDVQATLPSNCRLYIENKALYLRAPKNSGSVLIVK